MPPRRPRLGPALALALAGCALPRELESATRNDFALELSARALPGWGGGLAFSQRLGGHGVRIEAELGLEHQRLSEAGPRGDDWDRIFGGLRWSALDEDLPRPTLRAGVTWIRADSEPLFLDAAGDYGGLYLGLALDWGRVGGWTYGPAIELMAVDSEGDRGGSGLVAQLAWHFRRHF